MIDPDKISWEQALTFFKILKSSRSPETETVRRWYRGESKNFEDTLSLLKALGVVVIKNGRILPTREFKRVISADSEAIRLFLINQLFKDKKELLEPFNSFFEGFEPYENSYLFIPTAQERLRYSGIRNFLISLEVLKYDQRLRGYIAKEKLCDYLTSSNKIFPYSQFLKKINAERELGYDAEVLVYDQEKSLFQDDPIIQKKIRHVALENVLAGYDIISFRKQEDGTILPRYIEVKAVSIEDWKFYWSRNEIDKAKLLRKNYYLYLVPVGENGTLDVSSIYAIEDPYHEVFLNRENWHQQTEILSFQRNGKWKKVNPQL